MMTETIQLFRPDIGAAELAAMRRVIESGWLGRGPETEAFEAEFAAYLDVPAACVASLPSCTDGLFHAMTLLDLAAGDEVILPSVSFVGAAQAILAAGGRPVLCDVDSRSLNATADTIACRLSQRTRAVLLLHYGGAPCVMRPILRLLAERRLALVEDSACSPASRVEARFCGTFGAMGVWSFDAMKAMTTGEGGMIFVADREQMARLKPRLALGLTSPSGYASSAVERWWEYDVTTAGRRSQVSDLNSAVGRVQLSRLPQMIERRRQIDRAYREALAHSDWLRLPPEPSAETTGSYYFFWIQLESRLRDRLARRLRERGIYSSFRYYPLHRTTLFRDSSAFPGADAAADTTLCLPLHSALSTDELVRVCESVNSFIP